MLKNISNKDNLSLDNVCYLISFGNETQDEIGQWVQGNEIKSLCFCAEIPIYSSEFFEAGRQGIQSKKTIVIDSESYEEQEIVLYGNDYYSVYRVFPRSDGMSELYLTEKVGDCVEQCNN